jgi:hypothetical protein
MTARVAGATGIAVGSVGVVMVGVGLWGRRETRCALARERITDPVGGGGSAPVTTAAAARSVAELIRGNTLAATGGRTYAEVEPYLDADGRPTAHATDAAKDERTGKPVENPDHDLWIQSTTLQTALVQAYMAFRVSDLTVALGTALAVAGLGLVAAGRE